MAIYIGTQKIDVSGVDKVYVGTQLVYQHTIPVYVTAISTSGQTIEYNLNDTFSYNGTCTATYSNGTTATVTPTASSPDMSTAGTKTVTLSYTEDGITVTTSYNITVYQTYTISYKKCMAQSTIPSSKTVRSGYALTSTDLPTRTDSNWSLTGWSTDGSTAVTAGTVVTSNITLKAIFKRSYTSANLYKKTDKFTYAEGESSSVKVTTASLSMGNVGNASTSTSSNTYALTKAAYSHTYSNYPDGYLRATMAAWGGPLLSVALDSSAKVEWTPSTASVTWTLSNLTGDGNVTNCYPGVVMRHTGTKAKIWATSQTTTNKISHVTGNPNSGSTITVYFQYGGNNGSNNAQQIAYRTGYKNTTSTSNITCNKSTATETFYLYTQ